MYAFGYGASCSVNSKCNVQNKDFLNNLLVNAFGTC